MFKALSLLPFIGLALLNCNLTEQAESGIDETSNDVILNALKERNDIGFNKSTRDLNTLIEDSSDYLFDPRDLEFHPGRANELWIANRGDDSITIVHNTGLENQYSENRQDSNHIHFLEEVTLSYKGFKIISP